MSGQGGGRLEEVIGSTSEEVTESLDRTEDCLRELSEEPQRRRRRRRRSQGRDAPAAAVSQGAQRTVDANLPDQKYDVELDWIITTNPDHRQEIRKEVEPEQRPQRVPSSHWFIQTQYGPGAEAGQEPQHSVGMEKRPKRVPSSHWIIQTQHGEKNEEGSAVRGLKAPLDMPEVDINTVGLKPEVKLDWIISTDPNQRTKVEPVPPEPRRQRAPSSEWFIQTRYGPGQERPQAAPTHLVSSQQAPDSHGANAETPKARGAQQQPREAEVDMNVVDHKSPTKLDWIISTDSRKRQSVERVQPQPSPPRVPSSHWVIQTQYGVKDDGSLSKAPQNTTTVSSSLPSQKQKPTEQQIPPKPKADEKKSSEKHSAKEAKKSTGASKDILDNDTGTAEPKRRSKRSSLSREFLQRGDPKRSTLSKEFLQNFPSAEAEAYVEPEIEPSTAASELHLRPRSSHTFASYLDILSSRHGHSHMTELSQRASSGSDAKTATSHHHHHHHHHRHHPRFGSAKSEMDLLAFLDERSISELKSRSARIRARRRRRCAHHLVKDIRPTEEKAVKDHAITLTPLRAPISIDSKRKLTRNCDQVNLRQVLRIYGAGEVVEPYDRIPRRTSLRSVRGMATVRYGRNMIEIAIQNTDVEPSKRGRVGNWIFTHAPGVHTVPVVLGRTWLDKKKGPAPFCLSVPSPFWVSVHQEQIAAPRGGECIVESIEVRSCNGSTVPSYEMKPLDSTKHPFFKEHIYLGKGVIRIDRSAYIPVDNQARNFYAADVGTTLVRQYRIQLPWRKQDGVTTTGIPRAPQIRDIRVKPLQFLSPPKKIQKIKSTTDDGEKDRKGKKKKKRGRGIGHRKKPPRSADVTGFNIQPAENQDDSYALKKKASRFTFLHGTAATRIPAGDSLKASMKAAYAPPKHRLKQSKTFAGAGVVDSSEEISPVQLSEREIIDAKKESELRKVASKIMHKKKKKEKPKVQSQTSSKEPPVLKPPRAKGAKEASKPAKKENLPPRALAAQPHRKVQL